MTSKFPVPILMKVEDGFTDSPNEIISRSPLSKVVNYLPDFVLATVVHVTLVSVELIFSILVGVHVITFVELDPVNMI